VYDVDSAVGLLLIVEGWAEPVGLIVEGSAEPVDLPSLKNAIAADIALDDAIAAAIERQTCRHD
jgi:hypothetical protein